MKITMALIRYNYHNWIVWVDLNLVIFIKYPCHWARESWGMTLKTLITNNLFPARTETFTAFHINLGVLEQFDEVLRKEGCFKHIFAPYYHS